MSAPTVAEVASQRRRFAKRTDHAHLFCDVCTAYTGSRMSHDCPGSVEELVRQISPDYVNHAS